MSVRAGYDTELPSANLKMLAGMVTVFDDPEKIGLIVFDLGAVDSKAFR